MPVEIRVTRPEKYSLIEPDLPSREGYYFTGKNQRDAINKATIKFGSETIDVQLDGTYLGLFKRVEIGTEMEHFIQLPHVPAQNIASPAKGSTA